MKFNKFVNQLLSETSIYSEYEGMSADEVRAKREKLEKRAWLNDLRDKKGKDYIETYFSRSIEQVDGEVRPLSSEEMDFLANTKPEYINTSIPLSRSMQEFKRREQEA